MSIALLCEITQHGVDDDPGAAEGEDANNDQDIQEPLTKSGKIRGVGNINIPAYNNHSSFPNLLGERIN